MRETSILEIDFGAIRHNLAVFRSIAESSVAICAVVKADGYGLGAAAVGTFLKAEGVEMLAVYSLPEAAQLMETVSPVLLLMPAWQRDIGSRFSSALDTGRLHLSVHGHEHLEEVRAVAESQRIGISLHIDIDTGLHRGGTPPSDVHGILQIIASHPLLTLRGLSTHFAAADSDIGRTQQQHAIFAGLLRNSAALIPGDCLCHAANTWAALRDTCYHGSMIRIGQGWAGYGTETIVGEHALPRDMELAPVLAWRSSIVHRQPVRAGQSVGYGGAWTAGRPTIIGVIPCGYADGYPALAGGSRSEQDHAHVGIRDVEGNLAWAPVVGSISMDQMTVDLTDAVHTLPGAVGVGSIVELVSRDRSAPNHLPRIAGLAGMRPYEFLSRLHPRLSRQYLIAESRGASRAPAAAAC